MKFRFTLFLALLNCFGLSVQAQKIAVLNIRGVVTDSINNSPVPNAEVVLYKGNIKLKTVITNIRGDFSFSENYSNDLSIALHANTYIDKQIPVILKDDRDTLFVVIYLGKKVEQLREVTVKGDKKYIKQDLDKLSYNIKADPESKNATTLEMLRKVPMVSIGMNENIEINGRKTYVILLNGKPSNILSADPASFLNGQQANIIDRVEVITTPASKYAQNGITEVLNIVTKDYEVRGMQATLRTGYTTLNKLNSSIVGELKNGGFGISIFGSHLYNAAPHFYTSYNLTGLQPNITNVIQNGQLRRRYNSLLLLPEVSYELDSLNLFVMGMELSRAPYKNFQELTTLFLNSQEQNTTNSNINTLSQVKNLSFSVYYQHQGKKNKNRLLSLGYRFSSPENETDIEIIEENLGSSVKTLQANDLQTKEHILQLDYAHPLKSIIIETGIKNIFRRNNGQGSIKDFTINENTSFNNSQDANILYNTYYWRKKNWGLKTGLRYEGTRIIIDNIIKRDFNNIVPTINFQIKFKKSMLSLNYDQNIERPSIAYLSNFVNLSNPAYNFVGNPELKPSITHKFELNFNSNGKQFMRFTAYYNRTIRDILSFTTNVNDTLNLISYNNGGVKDDLGLKFSSSWLLFKKLNYSINARGSFVDYNANVRNTAYQNQGFEIFTTNNLSYLLKGGWRIEGYLRVSNPYVQPQGKGFWWTDHTFSVNKKFLKNLMNCTVSVENPFMGFRNRQNFLHSNSAFIVTNERARTRALSFNVSYRFGKMKYEIKKNSKQIQNNDLKSEQ